MLRVVIADDHRLLLGAAQAVLAPVEDIDVCGVTHDASLILGLVGELEPDLLLLDCEMPGLEALALLDDLRVRHRSLAVVVMTESSNPERAAAVLARGARAVVPKTSDPDTLAPTLRAAMRGEPGRADPAAASRGERALGLTPREEEVLLAMGRGLSNAEIARELSIGKGTVKFHLHHVYEKLGVASRLEALRVVVEQALFGNPFNWL